MHISPQLLAINLLTYSKSYLHIQKESIKFLKWSKKGCRNGYSQKEKKKGESAEYQLRTLSGSGSRVQIPAEYIVFDFTQI